jgi:hypothetical protein
MEAGKVYALYGQRATEQAESSSANPAAGGVQMRILVELQVISYLLHQAQGGIGEDLTLIRQNCADSIT